MLVWPWCICGWTLWVGDHLGFAATGIWVYSRILGKLIFCVYSGSFARLVGLVEGERWLTRVPYVGLVVRFGQNMLGGFREMFVVDRFWLPWVWMEVAQDQWWGPEDFVGSELGDDCFLCLCGAPEAECWLVSFPYLGLSWFSLDELCLVVPRVVVELKILGLWVCSDWTLNFDVIDTCVGVHSGPLGSCLCTLLFSGVCFIFTIMVLNNCGYKGVQCRSEFWIDVAVMGELEFWHVG
eukprot:gene2837-1822_t